MFSMSVFDCYLIMFDFDKKRLYSLSGLHIFSSKIFAYIIQYQFQEPKWDNRENRQ